jgi:hypothetical protein
LNTSLAIHAHFYQPPRENPFFDEVEAEQGAAPFHDWNERIERECYRAVVAARIPAPSGRIARIINTLEWISFNVGPTLFEWMERQAPDTYRAILAADQASVARLGHGNAIAQPYHHAILPLASRRDKVTEVRWGIADFRRRYGREPEGMWLPETAVDDETLDVLAQEGIRFTILAPHQVVMPPPNGFPGRYITANGREIALCLYDGDISHGVAFGGLVRDASQWLRAIEQAQRTEGVPHAAGPGIRPTTHTPRSMAHEPRPGEPRLVSMATDGETFGHHHKFGEMALARVIEGTRERGMQVENFASFLARHPAADDVRLLPHTSWSCAHGVERWRSNCGCRLDGVRYPSQAWRAPLRKALDDLASGLHEIFEREGALLLGDVWKAREAYGAVVSTDDAVNRARFLDGHAGSSLTPPQRTRALELLEMERDALRMFTSCGWFFDDIGGIEAKQVLGYALRALTLSHAATTLEPAFRTTLGLARSNDSHVGTGADVLASLVHAVSPEGRAAAAARALRELQLDPEPNLPTGIDVAGKGAAITVVSHRTLRSRNFSVERISLTAHDVRFSVTALDEPSADTATVSLPELPERARHAIRSAFRRALLPRCLTPDELRALAEGEVSLRTVLALALTPTIAMLSPTPSPDALGALDEILDLFEQLESTIPFDTQTAFWRIWSGAEGDTANLLRPFASRLGFTDEQPQNGSSDATGAR